MFFIIGLSQAEKRLNFDQLLICKCCGRYGHMEVIMMYSYFSFFFIPILKWNKKYIVRMNCCGVTCEIDPELGRGIEKGKVTSLDEKSLNFETGYGNKDNEFAIKQCTQCGFTTKEDYMFCPKCGTRI